MYYGHKRHQNIYVYISLLIPILVSILRFGVGTDYFNYVVIYNDLLGISPRQIFENNAHNIELGFYGIIKVSEILTHNYYLMFGISSFLTIIFFYLGLKRFNPKHKALIYFLFLTTIYPLSFNAVRQAIAMSIFFYASTYIVTKKPFKYLLIVLLASLFHISALFMLPVYFVRLVIKKNNNDSVIKFLAKFLAVLLLICLLYPIVINYIYSMPIMLKYVKYIGLDVTSGLWLYTLKIIIFFIFIILYKYLMKLDDKNNLYLWLSGIGIAISTIGLTSATIYRVSLYFMFFSIILIASCIDIFKENLGKHVIYLLVLVYAILYFYIGYFYLNMGDIFPYRMIIGG